MHGLGLSKEGVSMAKKKSARFGVSEEGVIESQNSARLGASKEDITGKSQLSEHRKKL